jgi:hypothetical protein
MDEVGLLRDALAALEGAFLVVVVGEFNSGKSTVINALLGAPGRVFCRKQGAVGGFQSCGPRPGAPPPLPGATPHARTPAPARGPPTHPQARSSSPTASCPPPTRSPSSSTSTPRRPTATRRASRCCRCGAPRSGGPGRARARGSRNTATAEPRRPPAPAHARAPSLAAPAHPQNATPGARRPVCAAAAGGPTQGDEHRRHAGWEGGRGRLGARGVARLIRGPRGSSLGGRAWPLASACLPAAADRLLLRTLPPPHVPPGTNVIVERQQRLTEEFVPRADMVLFVLSADRWAVWGAGLQHWRHASEAGSRAAPPRLGLPQTYRPSAQPPATAPPQTDSPSALTPQRPLTDSELTFLKRRPRSIRPRTPPHHPHCTPHPHPSTPPPRPLTDSELTFLKYIRQWRKKVVFVVNKVDLLDSQADVDKLLGGFLRAGGGLGGGHTPRLTAA